MNEKWQQNNQEPELTSILMMNMSLIVEFDVNLPLGIKASDGEIQHQLCSFKCSYNMYDNDSITICIV